MAYLGRIGVVVRVCDGLCNPGVLTHHLASCTPELTLHSVVVNETQVVVEVALFLKGSIIAVSSAESADDRPVVIVDQIDGISDDFLFVVRGLCVLWGLLLLLIVSVSGGVDHQWDVLLLIALLTLLLVSSDWIDSGGPGVRVELKLFHSVAVEVTKPGEIPSVGVKERNLLLSQDGDVIDVFSRQEGEVAELLHSVWLSVLFGVIVV